jgi:hypothetical protein
VIRQGLGQDAARGVAGTNEQHVVRASVHRANIRQRYRRRNAISDPRSRRTR